MRLSFFSLIVATLLLLPAASRTANTATFTATPNIGLIPEALDNLALTFSFGGNALWSYQTTTTFNGGDAAKAGVITDSQSTWMETTVNGPALVSFYWQVSSEPTYDQLHFSIDAVERAAISGTTTWAPMSYWIPAGSHALRWTYSKDPSLAQGSDTGWVDFVQVTPGTPTITPSPTRSVTFSLTPTFSISPTPAPTPLCSYAMNEPADWALGQANTAASAPNKGAAVSASSLSDPEDALVAGGKVFVGDVLNNRILIWNSVPAAFNTPADVVVGQSVMTTNTAAVGQAKLNISWALYSDGVHLFVCDSGNSRVLIWNSIPTVSGANADIVLGQTSFTQNTANRGGAIAANTLSDPRGIFYDGTRLYVSDSGNHRVLIWNSLPVTSGVAANLVLGQPDFLSGSSNQGGLVAGDTLNFPKGLLVNNGRLWLADGSNNRVLCYNTLPFSSSVSADFALGQPDLNSGDPNQGGAVGPNTFSLPERCWIDASNRMYVSDSNNSRIVAFSSLPNGNGIPGDFAIGQADLYSDGINQNGASATDRTLNEPGGGFPSGSKLFIADWGNNRITMYDCGFVPTATPSMTFTLTPTPPCPGGGVTGNASQGPNTFANSGYVDGCRYWITGTANAISLGINLTIAGSYRLALYTDSGGATPVPVSLVAQSASLSGSVGWNVAPVGPAAVGPGYVWIVHQVVAPASVAYTTSPSPGNSYKSFTYGTFPALFPTGLTSDQFVWSMYVNLCPMPTPTSSPTPSATRTRTPTTTPTASPSATATTTATRSGTPTLTATTSSTRTITVTFSVSPTITVTSTSTPTPMLLDNYDNDNQYNLSFLNDAVQNTQGNGPMLSSVSGGALSISWTSATAYFNSNFISDPGCYDASAYGYLTFKIRGAAGGESFMVNVEDRDASCTATNSHTLPLSNYMPVTTQWQTVQIALSDFGLSLSRLKAVLFQQFSSPSGSIYVDDLLLIQNAYTATATASATVSPTPSQTPTFTASLTVTRTFSPTATPSVTATFSPSLTATSTDTPSATSSATPSATLTPSPCALAPSSVLLDPGTAYTNNLSGVDGQGTASCGVLANVEISLRRQSDSFYWGGSAFDQPAEFWLSANSFSPPDWTYSNGLFVPSDGETYLVRHRATDSLSNVESPGAPFSVTYCQSPPLVSVSNPADLGSYVSLAQFDGSATQACAPLLFTEVSLQRNVDSKYWNGSTWQAGTFWNSASGTSAWTYASLPAFSVGSYQMRVKERDAAGNDGLSPIVNFSIVPPSPTNSPTLTDSPTPTSSPTWTPTSSPTWTPTSSPTWTPTSTPTWTATSSPTWTPTSTPTWTATSSPTWTPTGTPTWTATSSPTWTPTSTPTWTATSSPTWTPTGTPTWTATSSPTWTPTSSPTWTPTWTPTSSPSWTPTSSPTWTLTSSPTSSVTPTWTRTITATWTPTSSPSWTPTSSPTWTLTSSPTSSSTPTWTRTITATWTPTSSPSWTPTITPTWTPTSSQTITATWTPTWSPSSTATYSATATFTLTRTPTPTASPTATPSSSPSATASWTPTSSPSLTATTSASPTPTRTASPTFSDSPTSSSTVSPSVTATLSATRTGSPTPTDSPSATSSRTFSPTRTASPTPSASLTITPTRTATPTVSPQNSPSNSPTATASASTTQSATQSATFTVSPTITQTFTVTDTFSKTATPGPTATAIAPVVLSVNVFKPEQGGTVGVNFKPELNGAVQVKLYNISGELIRVLFDGDVIAGLWYFSSWDGRNDHAEITASGVYFVSVRGAGIKMIRRVILIK